MGSRMLCMSEARQGGSRNSFHFPQLPVSMVLRCSASDVRQIAAARRCAEAAHRGTRRKVSGLPYIIHPLGVAVILAAAGYEIDFVIAGLLHDAVEDGAVEPRDLERQFGETVARLVVSVTNTPHGGTWREGKTQILGRLNLNSEVRGSFWVRWTPFLGRVDGQSWSTGSSFGEVGNSQARIFSSKGILAFNPPQLSDRWMTTRRPARPRIAPQVSTCVRIVAGSR
jgi:hypothetical protein